MPRSETRYGVSELKRRGFSRSFHSEASPRPPMPVVAKDWVGIR